MTTVGEELLRAENVERAVKGFALQEYRMKQVVAVSTSNAWKESYYQESATELTAKGTRSVKGVPRGAGFPYGEVSFTKKSSYILKHGMEGIVLWEDALSDNVDVIARTMLRIARAVAKSVDDEIWTALRDGASNSITISAGYEWDSATVAQRDPVQDLLNAKREISIDNYDPDKGGFAAVSPTDYANIMANAKVLQNPTFKAADVVANGKVARLVGLDLIVSNSVTADYALVGIKNECGTWKQAIPLTVATIVDPGIKYTIRAYEEGVTQVINPNALCKITNTQK